MNTPGIVQLVMSIADFDDFLTMRVVCKRWADVSMNVRNQWRRWMALHFVGEVRKTIPLPVQVFRCGLRRKRNRWIRRLTTRQNLMESAAITYSATIRNYHAARQMVQRLDMESAELHKRYPRAKRRRIDLSDF